jgi:hypothetical protein
VATIHVKPTQLDRSVALAERHDAHPGGEAWVVGYPDEPNAVHEVGDTALVRQQIARGALARVDAPPQAAEPAKTETEKDTK